MAVLLRVSVADREAVDRLLAELTLKPVSVFRRGAGANFEVSAADLSDMERQIGDAGSFLALHAAELSALSEVDGFESMTLDFAITIGPDRAATFARFPPELLSAIGRLGIALELSIYAADESED